MHWLKVSVAVVLTSAVLVAALLVTGLYLAGSAMASGIHTAAQVRNMGDHNLPPELAGLKDVPAAERFTHFRGIQVSLTDEDGAPINISVTPGVASNVSSTSLTVAGNDGASHTYALNDQTYNRGTTIASDDKVVVVTINNTTTARAVLSANPANWHHS